MLLVKLDAVGKRQTCGSFALLLLVYEGQAVPAVHRRECRHDQRDGKKALPKTH